MTEPKPSEKLLQTGGPDSNQSPRFHRRLTLRHAFLSWWRENLHAHGLFETTLILRSELWQFGREATPARRKSRYGDIEFDCDYRVDTTSANVSRRMDLLGIFGGTPYQPCDPTLFHQTIRALNIDYGEFDFIDLGSGKGRALLMASDYPFRRILGSNCFANCTALPRRISGDTRAAVRNVLFWNRGAEMRANFNFQLGQWSCFCLIRSRNSGYGR